MFIISIPEKRLQKNSTNFQKILLENSKPNYCQPIPNSLNYILLAYKSSQDYGKFKVINRPSVAGAGLIDE